jgi:hypothetical protein
VADTFDVQVSIEAAVHRAFATVANEIAKEHGLLVMSIELKWGAITTVDRDDRYVTGVRITTETKQS